MHYPHKVSDGEQRVNMFTIQANYNFVAYM